MLQDMEKRKIIESSTAAWLSPIAIVSKPDGSKRMGLDYRHVNKHLTAASPARRISWANTLDMKDAYFQIPLDEECRDLITFSDGVTLYWLRRLPFALNCSSATFSRRTASLFNLQLKEVWIKYHFHDLILMVPNIITLLESLEQLLYLLIQNGIKLNLGLLLRKSLSLDIKFQQKGVN